ncbi:MAG: DUF2085 domain-containing protein [Anaerolineae bacterium]|nr:DUF2085 domain-containing protein [Anaerolineae bacterium]
MDQPQPQPQQPDIIRRIPPDPPRTRIGTAARGLAVIVTAVVLVLWLEGTPPGIEGKARAVGYAICHQITVRTFAAGDVTMPLCARCTGTYLGVIVGFAGPLLMGRGRAGEMPSRRVLIVLGVFFLMWAGDGLNSYLHLFPNAPGLYEPSNELRLFTGSMQGIAMAGLIYPLFNQTVWRRWRRAPHIRDLRDLAALAAATLALDALVLVQSPALLSALGLLSAAGVLLILTAIQTVIVVMVTGRINRINGWRDLILPVIVGFGLAIAMIGAIDALRYAAFGTWEGFTIPARD